MPKTDPLFDPARYATVAERITLFYQQHPLGRIETDLIARDAESVTFRARVYREAADTVAAATGWATEREGDGDINTVACLENTETSAIGRALANLGYTASRQRPSREEMLKAERAREHRRKRGVRTPSAGCVSESSERFGRVRSDATQCGGVEEGPEHAHAVADLLTLLAVAERAGLAPERAERVRLRLERGAPVSLDRMRDWEQSLRRWLAERATGDV